MVCYLFETILLELCIAPRDNVSKSLGFETFVIVLNINRGADEEWLEHEQYYESVIDLLEEGDGDVMMVD